MFSSMTWPSWPGTSMAQDAQRALCLFALSAKLPSINCPVPFCDMGAGSCLIATATTAVRQYSSLPFCAVCKAPIYQLSGALLRHGRWQLSNSNGNHSRETVYTIACKGTQGRQCPGLLMLQHVLARHFGRLAHLPGSKAPYVTNEQACCSLACLVQYDTATTIVRMALMGVDESLGLVRPILVILLLRSQNLPTEQPPAAQCPCAEA